jgi:hypothetical protein
LTTLPSDQRAETVAKLLVENVGLFGMACQRNFFLTGVRTSCQS